MKRNLFILAAFVYIFINQSFAQGTGQGSRMKEIFQVQELSTGGPTGTRYKDPWEVTYGPDDSLWITEAKNYKLYKVSPNGGARRIVLDISQNSTFLTTTADRTFNLQFNFSGGTTPNPQGGFAGLAIHPNFLTGSPYVFVSYIWKYVTTLTGGGGAFFKNSLVRFTYNSTTGLLGNPMMVCDTLPGSSDHNSQRIIIAPVNGINYLFYASGDMGAGQFTNSTRKENAQTPDSYEGKILRFNLDPLSTGTSYDKWIPGDNPLNGPNKSAVWSIGLRNNQGFAYAKINGTEYLYGQSHGPFSDDEINIIKRAGNYGHPLVIGYAADGNYNGAAAGVSTTYGGSLPMIGSESLNAAGLANYQDPIYTFFPTPRGANVSSYKAMDTTIQQTFYNFNNGQQGNGNWISEAPSGLDIYTSSMIPGWKNSLLSAALKGIPKPGGGGTGGNIIRMTLSDNGDTIMKSPNHSNDTVGLFISQNRFRDLAVSPDGLSFFAIIDSSSTTSGPTGTNPANSLCKGCLLKYTFLGYADNGTTSNLPDTITIATGIKGVCINANTDTISPLHNNTNIWVPITDSNSNVIAEIYANGNDLGTVTTSYYLNPGTVREYGSTKALYADRSITITPSKTPSTAVKIRLYLTDAELTALKNGTNSLGQPSGVSTISNVGIFKNNDLCNSTLINPTTRFTPTAFTRKGTGTNSITYGYALQTSVTSFSTFYFAKSTGVLPLQLISFTGVLNNATAQLQWILENENDAKNFIVERSLNGNNFTPIGTVAAKNIQPKSTYNYEDQMVNNLSCATVYYRLRMVDADEKYTYSNVIAINLTGVSMSIAIHPNPVIKVATIKINAVATENSIYQLIDNTGKVISHKNILLVKGPNTFTLNLSNMAPGIYYLKVTGDIISQKIKFEKL